VSRQGSDLHAPGPLTGSIRRDVDVGQKGALETDAPSMNSRYSAYFRLVPIRRTVAALSGSPLPRSTFRHFPV